MITGAGNPVLSTPNGQQLDRALASLEFMVSVDFYLNETTPHGMDLGALKPCLPDRLATQDKKIECAPAPLLDDIPRLLKAQEETGEHDLLLIGRLQSTDIGSGDTR